VARLQIERQWLRDTVIPNNRSDQALLVLERLGQIQTDPMNVVGRSEHLILWSRINTYRPGHLEKLRNPRPQVFEYWTRAASILPMSVYPLIRPVMNRRRTDHWWPKWVNWWLDSFPDVRKAIGRKIEKQGPMTAGDFPEEKGKKGWGNWKVSKQGLEALWTIGELAVYRRRGNEKVFDLTERILPRSILNETGLDEWERIKKLLKLALRGIGACKVSELVRHYGHAGWPPERKLGAKDISEMARAGWLTLFTITGSKDQWVCLSEDLPLLMEKQKPALAPKMTFLSPFDNLLWDRNRVRELFSFDYKFEGYTPAAKRRFGCYTMPVLWGNKLIGRINPKLDRDNKKLVVNGIWFESGIAKGKELIQELACTFSRFATFLDAKNVEIVATSPKRLRTKLVKLL